METKTVRSMRGRRYMEESEMDRMKDYLPDFNNCLQWEPPFCQNECPWDLDVPAFIEKVRRGAFNAAYKMFQGAVGFPEIAVRLCAKGCQSVCPLRSSVHLLKIEKAVLKYATKKTPIKYNLPAKQEKVAIVGAGISGLACAVNLVEKNYNVTVYERSGRIGGQLWDLMRADIFMEEFKNRLPKDSLELRLNDAITSIRQLKAYDAIYLATGRDGTDFGLLSSGQKEPCAVIDGIPVFAGGSLCGATIDYALSDGLQMGRVLDAYFKTGRLEYLKRKDQTKMILDPSHLQNDSVIIGASPEEEYTKEEAIKEAERCIMCQCDACRVHCDLLEYINKWPLRVRDEIIATTLPGKSEVKRTPAKRTINLCTQCGLCEKTCPERIDMKHLIMEARKSMHDQNKMPWVFHDYWIRDMEFSNAQGFLRKSAPSGRNQYVFFPGCQFIGISPRTVMKAYEQLLAHESDTGLLLACCGAPARWAGDSERSLKTKELLRDSWKSLGEPIVILACPTCANQFQQMLPEVKTSFIYEWMADWDIPLRTNPNEETWSIFDPCASAEKPELRRAVRTLASKAGLKCEPLYHQEAYSACCGYGGQGAITDPNFTAHVVKKRISESKHPYLTYCINCRDHFNRAGKQAKHILEILFDIEPEAFTITEMREHRISQKNQMLERFWNEKDRAGNEAEQMDIKLIIDEALAQKLSQERILEDEMANVVSFCEKSGRKIYDTQKNTYIGYRKIGYATYWAEYKKTQTEKEPKYKLVNGYQHRMSIELEVVWNGQKIGQE